jgi:transposase
MTDPDARVMRSRGTGIVGYNVQTAVESAHHLIVAHTVSNQGNDRDFLTAMGTEARIEMGVEVLEVVADRGYYKGQDVDLHPIVTQYLHRIVHHPSTDNLLKIKNITV